MWVKAGITTGSQSTYINLDAALTVQVRETNHGNGQWVIRAGSPYLDLGPYATEAEAVEVMRKIVGGIDLRNDLGY